MSEQGIGTMKERTLHAMLKKHFEPDGNKHEQRVGSYIVDIQNEEGITEIQTRGFGAIRDKLAHLLQEHPVRLVYPIACTKRLIWVDPETGEATPPRKSPKKGAPCDAFAELYAVRQLLFEKRLTVVLVMLDIDEYRTLTGWSKDKKKGSRRIERVPGQIHEILTFSCAKDYQIMLPPSLPAQFTVKDYRACTRLSQRQAGTAVSVLRFLGVIEKTGKQKNAIVYRAADL